MDLKGVCGLSLTNLEAEMKYCGIDLHSNNSLVSVVDEEDHMVAEKRLPNDLGKMIGLIEPWRAELQELPSNPPSIGTGWSMG